MTRRFHPIFAIAVVCLVALGAWWTVFLSRAVEFEQEARLARLRNAAELSAMLMGHDPAATTGPFMPGDVPMEVVETATCTEAHLCVPITPFHPQLSVRPSAEAIQAVEDKLASRRAMILGEGGFLFLLLGIVMVMLARLVLQERRHTRQMEDFVSAVTHEMKTPLAGIKSLLQTMEAGRVPEELRPSLLVLGLKEAERLEHTIQNVLLSGSIRTDRLQVHPVDLPLREHLEDFVGHRRRTLGDRPEALSLVWPSGAGDIAVRADPHPLRVILENLVDNGLKYGGEEPEVRLVVVDAPDRVCIEVVDRGLGFAPERADQLFAAFRRASDARDQVQHGTGLGLSIARTLARRMGGDLTARSDGPGTGATFEVSLRRGGRMP